MPAVIPPPTDPPLRRVPNVPLPAYRYVPGLQAHPFRHEGGHMYTDGSAPCEQPWNPETPWKVDERYLFGADLFDHRYYWEAHEAWEALWHSAAPDSNIHRLLQSLIQYAAATLKFHTGHQRGALRLYNRATERLEIVKEGVGPTFRGMQLDELHQRIHRFLRGGEWPTLPMEHP